MLKTILAFLAATGIPVALLTGLFWYGLTHYTKSLPDSQTGTFMAFLAILVVTPLVQLALYLRYLKRDEEMAAGFLYAVILEGIGFLLLVMRFCGA